jgi:hypothetical protein
MFSQTIKEVRNERKSNTPADKSSLQQPTAHSNGLACLPSPTPTNINTNINPLPPSSPGASAGLDLLPQGLGSNTQSDGSGSNVPAQVTPQAQAASKNAASAALMACDAASRACDWAKSVAVLDPVAAMFSLKDWQNQNHQKNQSSSDNFYSTEKARAWRRPLLQKSEMLLLEQALLRSTSLWLLQGCYLLSEFLEPRGRQERFKTHPPQREDVETRSGGRGETTNRMSVDKPPLSFPRSDSNPNLCNRPSVECPAPLTHATHPRQKPKSMMTRPRSWSEDNVARFPCAAPTMSAAEFTRDVANTRAQQPPSSASSSASSSSSSNGEVPPNMETLEAVKAYWRSSDKTLRLRNKHHKELPSARNPPSTQMSLQTTSFDPNSESSPPAWLSVSECQVCCYFPLSGMFTRVCLLQRAVLDAHQPLSPTDQPGFKRAASFIGRLSERRFAK